MHVMNQACMTRALPDACLQHLISTLLLKLAEARVRLLEGGAALMQGMNVLMMRTLNHCDQYAPPKLSGLCQLTAGSAFPMLQMVESGTCPFASGGYQGTGSHNP